MAGKDKRPVQRIPYEEEGDPPVAMIPPRAPMPPKRIVEKATIFKPSGLDQFHALVFMGSYRKERVEIALPEGLGEESAQALADDEQRIINEGDLTDHPWRIKSTTEDRRPSTVNTDIEDGIPTQHVMIHQWVNVDHENPIPVLRPKGMGWVLHSRSQCEERDPSGGLRGVWLFLLWERLAFARTFLAGSRA